MSFLLAVQLAARDATSSRIRSVARQLEPNQRTYFEDAYHDLMPDAVAERLHLTDRASWPAERPVPLSVAGWLASYFVSGPPLAWLGGWTVVAWLTAGPVIGFAFGKRRRRDRCSDPSCNAVLPQSASACPGGGGIIAATIKHRDERLDAEERFRVNRADYEADVGSESAKLARGARPLFTPTGVAGGLIGADVHEHEDRD